VNITWIGFLSVTNHGKTVCHLGRSFARLCRLHGDRLLLIMLSTLCLKKRANFETV